jgi:hypothetical protein
MLQVHLLGFLKFINARLQASVAYTSNIQKFMASNPVYQGMVFLCQKCAITHLGSGGKGEG